MSTKDSMQYYVQVEELASAHREKKDLKAGLSEKEFEKKAKEYLEK